MPAAELEVRPELVRRLLRAQHPDLADLPLEVVANGWDNVIVKAGDHLVVRLPRRQAAAQFIVNEQHWLPILAPRLPLPIPAPLRVGQPGCGYPWPWTISAFLPGQTAARTPPADQRQAAESLGAFLAALHTTAATDAPVNASRGIPLAQRQQTFTQNLAALGGVVDPRAANRLWEAAVQAPAWPEPSVWLHGDLHPANIIVHDGRIGGVIDFGDITAGDPATDLSVCWMLLPPTSHEHFWAGYARGTAHETGADLRLRAKGWALALALVFLAYSSDNPLLTRIGQRTLSSVLA